MKRFRKKTLDFDLPQQDDEVVLSPLEATRVLRYVSNRLHAAVVFGGITLILMMMSGTASFLWSRHADQHLVRVVQDVVDVRTENRITSCNTIQELQVNLNGVVQGTEDLVRTTFTITSASRSPEVRAQVEAFVVRLNTALEKTKIINIRDCSTAGLKAYYHEK